MPDESEPAEDGMSPRDLSICNDSFVEIQVASQDDKPNIFLIHEQLLCNASPFFRGAFLGKFQESKLKKMELEDVEVETMDEVVVWLYSGHYSDSLRSTNYDPNYWLLVRLNTFAERYCIAGLTRDVVSIIMDFLNSQQEGDDLFELPTVNDIKEVYDTSPPSNYLRKLIVALSGVHLNTDWYWSKSLTVEFLEGCPAFAVELAATLGHKLAHPETTIEWDNSFFSREDD